MAQLNENYDKLAAGYLFPEIARRTSAFSAANPGVSILRLGIGNTTEPLTPSIITALHRGVDKLAVVDTYSGYGDEQGNTDLRKALADFYSVRGVSLDSSEFFVSDGAKPDTANIQSIFSLNNIIAVQDPAYPVYVDTNVVAGRTGGFNAERQQYDGIVYMPCNESNGFTPSLPSSHADLIYLCSPNNPTGAVMTHDQLKMFVDYAREHKSVIIFDSAYSMYIADDNLPKSIFEIEGAKECAIEISSYSKWSGFTGVRLGWSIIPKDLVVGDSEPGKANKLWNRRQTTFFNGASNIAQEGGLEVLTAQGQMECAELVAYYMDNAQIIKQGLDSLGLKTFGGANAPYIWVQTPNNMDSWDFFDKMLNETNVVVTPGAGFGPSGQGYFRVSAFGHRQNIIKAVENIKTRLKL